MPAAAIIITLALIFYTIGVWAEHRQETLLPWHLAMFGLGLACDITGTYLMSKIPSDNPGTMTTIMMITGALALILMMLHLAWAAYTYLKGSTEQKAQFHRYSVIVWAIWLIPYFSGALGAMIG